MQLSYSVVKISLELLNCFCQYPRSPEILPRMWLYSHSMHSILPIQNIFRENSFAVLHADQQVSGTLYGNPQCMFLLAFGILSEGVRCNNKRRYAKPNTVQATC